MSIRSTWNFLKECFRITPQLIPKNYISKFNKFTNLSVDEKSKILYDQAQKIISHQCPLDQSPDKESLESLLPRINVLSLSNNSPTQTQHHWSNQIDVKMPLEGRLTTDQELINKLLLKHIKKPAILIGIGSWNGHETFHFLKNIAQTPSLKYSVAGVANIDGSIKATQIALLTSQVLGLNQDLFFCYHGNAIESLPIHPLKSQLHSQIYIASRFINILAPHEHLIFLSLLKERLQNDDACAIVTNSIIDLQKPPSKVLVEYLKLLKEGILELEELPDNTGLSFVFARDVAEKKLLKGHVCQTFLYKDFEERFFEIHNLKCLEKSPPETEIDGITRIASVIKAAFPKK